MLFGAPSRPPPTCGSHPSPPQQPISNPCYPSWKGCANGSSKPHQKTAQATELLGFQLKLASKELTLVTVSDVKHGISSVVLVIAIVFAMSGWICALGWVAFKLFEFV